MSVDFINTYMPAPIELDSDTLYETRRRLVMYCQTVAPDVETNPNTVLGDLIVTPQTYVIAAIENGLDKFMSDLDLENIANGNINNCEFVSKYLNLFATDSTDRLKASGMIRIIITKDQRYVLDRGLRFTTGSHIFSLYLPNMGPFTIYSPNDVVPAGTNGTVMIDAGDGTFFADVPVVGETGQAEIAAGTSFTLSYPVEEFTAVTALIDFDPGSEVISYADLAKRARTTLHSASLNTRNGAINYVKNICPFIDGVYAVHNGDREMLRDYRNVLGISMGCLDLYVRSSGYNFTEKQTLTLYLNKEGTAYEGVWHYTGQPYHVESVTHNNVDLPSLPHTITSTNNVGLGVLGSYTIHEKLFISIPEALDEDGDSLFDPVIDEDGKFYTQFTITYQTDPMLPSVAHTVENDDYTPINTSVLVRGFIPIIIDKFEVVYVRQPGVVPDIETARTNIKKYMGNLGAPDTYSDAEIAHIMQEAGVKYMKEIVVRARVQWSVGHKTSDFEGNIVDVLDHPTITKSSDLRIVWPDPAVDFKPDDMYSCSVRNIRYWFMENALTFKEVRDI